MRTIKFRAWNNITHKMSYGIEKNGFGVYLELFSTYSVMQFTGLKDKNGKEIYEGDILCFINTLGDKQYYSVLWDSVNACYRTTPNTSVPNSIWYGYFEVIGNIYENPELLGVNNDK